MRLKIRGLLFYSFIFMLIGLIPLAKAAWVDPGCDPAVSGPGCASISAPLNVSSTNQTKTGGITAGGLTSTNGLNVTGSVVLPPNSVLDAAVQDNVTANRYVLKTGDTVSGNLTVNGTTTCNNLTANGTLILPNNSVTDAMVTDSITANKYVARTGDTMTGSLQINSASSGLISNSTTGYGVYGTSTDGYGLFATSGNNNAVYAYSNNSVGINGFSYTNYGIYGATIGVGYAGVGGLSSAGPGVYGTTGGSSYYGVMGCSGSANCGSLGGNTYAGYFNGAVKSTGQIESDSNIKINANKGLTLYDEAGNAYCIKMFSNSAAAPGGSAKVTGPGSSVMAISSGVCI